MKEQGFPFEKPDNERPEPPKGVFILSFFEDKGLNEEQAKLSLKFREIAHQLSEMYNEGTVRTTLLERLLDIRETSVKRLK